MVRPLNHRIIDFVDNHYHSAKEFDNRKCPCCNQKLPEIDELVIDHHAHALIYRGKCIYLTSSQLNLLEVLVKRFPTPVSREDLHYAVYRNSPEGIRASTRAIDVFIKHIRKTLKNTDLKIVTLYGIGYRLTRTEIA